ncbi:carbonic anhydrase 2-like [Parasteatoda tepidariorum]|uniref:carbonic anhydrase 2-like n=1 Tax=Parasteatoda tepidariorum TaxID=114398 RepID=UPI001C71CCEE|nr:carbonic anhydrase 2-like [Parasteatoda tepidariorum]
MQLMIWITIFWCIISSLDILKTKAQECPADRDKPWSYDPNFPNGPSNWSARYPDCNGQSQSPINIDTSKTSKAKGRQNLRLNGYETPINNVEIENNGHTIAITPRDGTRRSLDLDNVNYSLESFHFHWGNLSTKGSEHEINGRKYAMEAHFVHRNDQGEIAVVGVFFEENYRKNPTLDTILSVMDEYLYEDETFEGTITQWWLFRRNIYLENLVDNGCSYYRYNGSLTTPPCSENVTWLVCKPIKYVKRSQMRQLYSLYSVRRGTDNEDKCHLINNYRPIQPLNGRKVYA